MPGLSSDLSASERIIVAVDKSDINEANRICGIAADAGAWVVKLGLELSSATSWRTCSEVAANAGLEWVADAKIDDIPNTTEGIVGNLVGLEHPPVGITIHTNSGYDSMKAAQQIAGNSDVMMLGVTHLTSVDDEETKTTYGFLRKTLVKRRAEQAARAEIGGLVSSPKEVKRPLRSNPKTVGMFTMIPATRLPGADHHDQKNVGTPERAMIDGADLLVIGRSIVKAEDPEAAYGLHVASIELGLAQKRLINVA